MTPLICGTEREVKRAAVLIADVVEFSRRMEQDEGGSVDQVSRSIQLFRGLISDYGGQIAAVAGDGILALFDSADRALQFAVQIQTEFRDQSVWGDGEPIQFRIGLNVGEVTFHETVAYGHCINVAARLQAMADPGGILVTGAFRSAMQSASSGLLLRSVGQPRLKNLSEPIDIYAVEQSGAGADASGRTASRRAAERARPQSLDRGARRHQPLRRSAQRSSLPGHLGRYHREPLAGFEICW